MKGQPYATITREQILKMDRKAQREQMIAQGARTKMASITHRSEKDYKRNPKHKNREKY
jgi:hypothetical protein